MLSIGYESPPLLPFGFDVGRSMFDVFFCRRRALSACSRKLSALRFPPSIISTLHYSITPNLRRSPGVNLLRRAMVAD
jgi:hypothetical protein